MSSDVEVPTGIVEVGGNSYMTNAQGHMVPLDLVQPQHQLEDQTVRKMLAHAEELSARVARFRGHCFDDVGTFVGILAERYGASRGGKKGNVTMTSFDGCQKVVVQVQDVLTFGPELQVAKAIVDECIMAWGGEAPAEMQALVQHAFQVDKEGQINRASLFSLRRLKIAKEPWPKAMAALEDAIRVIGSREYVRFYKREHARAPWQSISIDLASVSEA